MRPRPLFILVTLAQLGASQQIWDIVRAHQEAPSAADKLVFFAVVVADDLEPTGTLYLARA